MSTTDWTSFIGPSAARVCMLCLEMHAFPDASLRLETYALPDACANLIGARPSCFASPPTYTELTTMKKCTSFSDHFDDHAGAAVQYSAHCLMEEVNGWLYWRPQDTTIGRVFALYCPGGLPRSLISVRENKSRENKSWCIELLCLKLVSFTMHNTDPPISLLKQGAEQKSEK
jgi:hypothetical protein